VGLPLLGLGGPIVAQAAVADGDVRRLAPRLGSPTLLRNALVGLVAVMLPGLIGHLLKAFGLLTPAVMLGGALEGMGKLLCLGAALAGMGAILRTRAGQPAPLPFSFPSAPMPPRMPSSSPAMPGPGAPEAAPPTA
jgi:hypothetical protein